MTYSRHKDIIHMVGKERRARKFLKVLASSYVTKMIKVIQVTYV